MHLYKLYRSPNYCYKQIRISLFLIVVINEKMGTIPLPAAKNIKVFICVISLGKVNNPATPAQYIISTFWASSNNHLDAIPFSILLTVINNAWPSALPIEYVRRTSLPCSIKTKIKYCPACTFGKLAVIGLKQKLLVWGGSRIMLVIWRVK